MHFLCQVFLLGARKVKGKGFQKHDFRLSGHDLYSAKGRMRVKWVISRISNFIGTPKGLPGSGVRLI